MAFLCFARTSHTSFISIFSPVCRNIAKQTFLETLQDNLIEMDILASARRDASYNDGYVACLLSGSHYCHNLLCHERNSDACIIFPSTILYLKCCQSSVYVPCSARIAAVCVPYLFDTTNNLHLVTLLGCITLINVKHGRFMKHSCPCNLLLRIGSV